MKRFLQLLLGFVFGLLCCTVSLSSQCNPAPLDYCDFGPGFCDLESLSGYTCMTPDATTFSNIGGNLVNAHILNIGSACPGSEIIVEAISCSPGNSSFEVRLYKDCEILLTSSAASVGSSARLVVPNGSQFYLNLVIFSAGQSICNYKVTCKAKNADLSKMHINGIESNKIEFCPIGTKNLFVSMDNNCPLYYTFDWYVDGKQIPNETEQNLSYYFDQEGSYTICTDVWTYIPYRCKKINTVCATVEVKNLFKGNVDYISCEGTVYIDPTSKKTYPNCVSQLKISENKTQGSNCEPYYYLSVSYPKFKPKWKIDYVSGQIEINPNIQSSGLCDARLKEESYAWYLKSDPNQNIISHDKILKVSKADNYCLIYTPLLQLNSATEFCPQEFCDPFTPSPIADFSSNLTQICPGKYVQFSEKASSDVVAWFWEFEGGEPFRSHYRNPEVYYDKPGIYPVKLTVENQYFSSSITRSAFVEVKQSLYCPAKSRKKRKLTGDEFLELNSRANRDIQIVPNPNNGTFVLTGLYEQDENLNLTIYDVTGKIKFVQNNDLSNQEFVNIPNSPLLPGQYILKIIVDGKVYVEKMQVFDLK